MKVQEVILRALAKKITWWQAAEIIGISDRSMSELIGLRWNDIHEDSITIDERYCRGDWGVPKTESSAATIAVNRLVIDRIRRLKSLTVEVKAGKAVRKYQVVKSDRPDDLVFQLVKDGKPIRDNNVLTRFIKPAARALGMPGLAAC
jgi:integrase